MKRQKLIINADDLGISESVNKAIELCLNSGVVTSSTIFAVGEAFDGVKRIVESHPQNSFGIHLSIDEGESLTKGSCLKERGIIDERGYFIKGAYLNVNYDDLLCQAVYMEWKAQVERVIKEGIEISHFDSHHHCHTHPVLIRILKKLVEEYGVEKVRLNLYKPIILILAGKLNNKSYGTPSQMNNSSVKVTSSGFRMLYKNHVINRFIKRNFVTASFFCRADYFLSKRELIKRYSCIEVECHPGHPAINYQQEINGLNKIDLSKYELISYKEL